MLHHTVGIPLLTEAEAETKRSYMTCLKTPDIKQQSQIDPALLHYNTCLILAPKYTSHADAMPKL